MVDVAGAANHGMNQRHDLAARASSAHPLGQAHRGVHQMLEFEAQGHGGDKQEPGVGHQARLVEAHSNPIMRVRYSTHRKCLPTQWT